MTLKQSLFGLHTVEALLEKQPERIIKICFQDLRKDKKIEKLKEQAEEQDIPFEWVSKQALDRLTENANHQGVVAFYSKPQSYSEADLKSILQNLDRPPFILILDGVQDPHNLGACFRSADAAGVHVIIAPKDKSVGLTATVSKVASGAAESIPFVQVTNLVRTLEELKSMGIWIYGAAGETETCIFQTDLSGPIAIVMGAEGIGLRRLTREHCDAIVKIPMFGSVSSLNVSVAAGVFLFEVVRQRLKNSPKK